MKTSLYTILCIVIPLGAVFLAVGTVIALPNLYFVAHNHQTDDVSLSLLTMLYLAALLVAFGLWLYPNVLASLAAGKAAREHFEALIDERGIPYIAFSVLGVSLLLKGLIAIVSIFQVGDPFFKRAGWREHVHIHGAGHCFRRGSNN